MADFYRNLNRFGEIVQNHCQNSATKETVGAEKAVCQKV